MSIGGEIRVPVSFGELVDKITILELKESFIADPQKRPFILRELHALRSILGGLDLAGRGDIAAARAALARVNAELWRVEDALRLCEARQEFGPEFLALARSVYLTNDERARIKRLLNEAFGSLLMEVKSYGGNADG